VPERDNHLIGPHRREANIGARPAEQAVREGIFYVRPYLHTVFDDVPEEGDLAPGHMPFALRGSEYRTDWLTEPAFAAGDHVVIKGLEFFGRSDAGFEAH
jgi:hypothetical protein